MSDLATVLRVPKRAQNYTSEHNYHHLFTLRLPYPTAVSEIELMVNPSEKFEVPAEVMLFGETVDGAEVRLSDMSGHDLFVDGVAWLRVKEPLAVRRVLVFVMSGDLGVA